ncbi:long-chain fatty acid--CoA ligase [bacterium]|nr:long-chain fatty acid--CoA ligase [bacterium]
MTAKQLLAEARNVVMTLDLKPEDRIYAPVPIFHSYGFDLGVLAMLFSGAPLILEEIFVPRKILSRLTAPEVTVFLGVPSMYRFLLEAAPPGPPDLSRLRYALSCTAPLNPDLIAAFHDKFHVPICQHYGSSETGAATTHLPQAVLDHPASVGVAMKNVELLIVDEQGRPLPAGQKGEVVVRSEAVAAGYAMGPRSEISPFKDGTFRMGDLGHLDKDGFLYLHGRKDALINVGGLKVSPDEVTMVLESCPAVREAAVIGVRDAMGEEIVYAAVALRSAASEKELLMFCSSRLADYKVPRRVDIFKKLPRGPSGKIKIDPPTL